MRESFLLPLSGLLEDAALATSVSAAHATPHSLSFFPAAACKNVQQESKSRWFQCRKTILRFRERQEERTRKKKEIEEEKKFEQWQKTQKGKMGFFIHCSIFFFLKSM